MANAYDYSRHVVGNYRRGMAGLQFGGGDLFDRNDKGENWNMRKIAVQREDTFWEVGWLHRGYMSAFTYGSPDPHDSYFYPRTPPPRKYWWCRDSDWLPYWGDATKKRANLMKEIRALWMNKWFGETVPEIKKTLLDTTPFPEDVINLLPEYFEYPYQTKMVN